MRILYSDTFHYTVPSPSSKDLEGQCALDIARYDNGVCSVMMTETKGKQAMSVTNACDRIATQVYSRLLKDMPADKVVWLEHSPASRIHNACVDLVQFYLEPPAAGHRVRGRDKNAGFVFSRPRWKRFFESRHLVRLEFLKSYGYVLKALCSAHLIFSIEDENDFSWRVWANQEGLFIVSANPAAELPDCMLDVSGVSEALRKRQHYFRSDINMEEQFTREFMRVFLNKGL